MKVFLYLRVSSEEQVKHGYSLDAQEDMLKDFCRKHDHVIVGTYRDEGISGRKPYTKRPAMIQLLDDLERVKPDMVLFTKLDRWFRNIREYYKVQDILDKNKVYWKAINEEYDTSTASGRLYVNIKLSIAQDEADRTSERIKDIHEQLVMQGKVLGGTVPFGFEIKDKHVVHGENMPIVRDAISYYMLHQSAHATTRYINDKYGLNFNHTRLLKLFKSTLLKGSYRTNPSYCEPVLTPAEWDDLQAVIQRNIKHASKKRTYMFSGLLVCPHCGRRLGGCFDGDLKYYRCTARYYGSCKGCHVSEAKLERWLLANIEEDFKVQVTTAPKKRKEDPKKYRRQLERLNDMYLLGNIDKPSYTAKSADIQRKIAELSKQPAETRTQFTAGWKDLYMQLDANHRRSFWRGLIKQITPTDDGYTVLY